MIFVCAGHHPLKMGESEGWFHEYPEAAHWANCLAYQLGESGIRVRDGVVKKKASFIEKHAVNGDIAVEVHFRSSHRGDGSEIRYCPGDEIGKSIAHNLALSMPDHNPQHGAVEGWYHDNPDNGPDFFFKSLPIPGILIVPDSVAQAARVRSSIEATCRNLALALLS